MWANNDGNVQAKRFLTPPASWRSPRSPLPYMPMSERRRADAPGCKGDIFHVIHKVPAGDSPYVRAKHVQLIDKDPSRAISLFWSAINAGDRVDSALKDMAVVMKQLNRSDEAIEAIRSFRHLCPSDSQESLDNVLIELYKRCGRMEEEIELLQHKLKNIEEGITFGGKRTKIARSQGKKIQITVSQEKSRVLGNLAWAYLQQHNYGLAEQHYRKALSLEPDKNKQCNLAICLMHMDKISEAKSLLLAVEASSGSKPMDESYAKSFERANQMLLELDSQSVSNSSFLMENEERYLTLATTNAEQGHAFGFVESGRWKGKDESILSVDSNLRNSCYVECCGERPRLSRKVKEDTVPTHVDRDTFASPALYTQPRRSYWGCTKNDQRESWGEDTVEQSVENVQAGTSCLPSLPERDLRILPRRTDNIPQERNISELEPVSQPTMKSHRKILGGYDAYDHAINKDVRQSSSWKRNDQEETANSYMYAYPEYPADETMTVTNARAAEAFGNGELNHGSRVSTVFGNMEPTDTDAGAADQNVEQYSSTKPPHRKTWADMVEEEDEREDEEELNQMFGGLKLTEEEYKDENLNANIIHQGFTKLDRGYDLKDWRQGTAKSAGFSRYPTVRRSLTFEDVGDKNTKRRSSRLQVFREITLSQDSP